MNWINPYSQGYRNKDERDKKRARKKFDRTWSALRKDREKAELGETLARWAGKGIGFMFGGPAGAAVGDLAAGGLYDKMDSNAEKKMSLEDITHTGGGKRYTLADERHRINDSLDSLNQQANTRHLTSPLKTYMSSMSLAEMGTPATGDAGWENMSFWDKSTRSGKDMFTDWKANKAAAAAAANQLSLIHI